MDWKETLKTAWPVIEAILILVIGHFAVRYLLKLLRKTLEKSKLDQSLDKFIIKALNIVLHVLLVIAALSAIGVSTTGVIAVLSAAAVAVSVGLKDSLSNVAGGILLLISPRFKTGDYIEAGGDEGTVLSVDLLHTTVLTVDSRQVSIPNGILVNSHITNYSCEDKRRVDIEFNIPYEADVEKAKKTVLETIMRHELSLKTPEPFVRVSGYNDSAVKIITRTWCKTDDYWNLYFDLTEQIRAALKENSIEIPYNHLEVHINGK